MPSKVMFRQKVYHIGEAQRNYLYYDRLDFNPLSSTSNQTFNIREKPFLEINQKQIYPKEMRGNHQNISSELNPQVLNETINRSFAISNRVQSETEHQNPIIIEFADDSHQKQKGNDETDSNWKKQLDRINFKLRICGNQQIYCHQITIILVFSIIYIATLVQSIGFYENVQSDQSGLLKLLPLFSLIFTIFTCAASIFEIFKNPKIWALSILIILPLFTTSLFYTTNTHFIVYTSLSLLIYICSLTCRALMTWFSNNFHPTVGAILVSKFFIMVPYWLGFQILLYALDPHRFSVSKLGDIIATPIFFCLLVISVFALQALFAHYPKSINWQTNAIKILFASLYTALALYAYIRFVSQFSKSQFDIEPTLTFGLLMASFPLHLLVGITFLNSQSPFLYPSILSVLQILATWADSYIGEKTHRYQKSTLVLISPTILTCFWSTVSYFRTLGFEKTLAAQTFCCYFFAFPLGFLWTISFGSDSSEIKQAIWIILIVGLVVLLVYYSLRIGPLIRIIKQLPQQAEKLDFTEYQSYDLINEATWLTTVLYSVSYFIIIHQVFNEPKGASSTTRGLLIGLLILHPLLFLAMHQLLKEKQHDERTPGKHLKQLSLITMCIMVYCFAVFLPLAMEFGGYLKHLFLSLALGMPLLAALYRLLTYMKNISGDYEKFVQPFLIILIQLFVVLPFTVIMPLLANYYEKLSTEFVYFAQSAVVYGVMFCIASVTGVALFSSILLNKEQLEVQRRGVVIKLMRFFVENKIYPHAEMCSVIFMEYLHQGSSEEELKKQLEQGNPVNVLPKNLPRYSRELVWKRDYSKRLAQRQSQAQELFKAQNPPKEENQQQRDHQYMLDQISKYLKSFGLMCVDCIMCKCGVETLNECEENIKKGQEFDMWILDMKERCGIYKRLGGIEGREHREIANLKFWCSLYEHYKGDTMQLLRLLNLHNVKLSKEKYNSYWCLDAKVTISMEDFAKILKENITSNPQQPYDDLQQFAFSYFPIFYKTINNLEELQNKFTYRNRNCFQKMNYNALTVSISQNQIVQQNQEQVISQLRQEISQNNLTPCEMQSFRILRSLNELLWVKSLQKLNQIIEAISCQFNLIIQPDLFDEVQPIVEKDIAWNILAELVAKQVAEGSRQLKIQVEEKKQTLQFTVSNVMAGLLRLFDLAGLAALAWDNQVGWTEAAQLQTLSPSNYLVDFQIIQSYYFHYFFALSLSIGYAVLGWFAASEIKKDTFGLNKDRAPPTIRDGSYWLYKAIILVSNMFLYVMKTFIDAFICDYGHEGNYRFQREPSLQCMGEGHCLFQAGALVGAFLYYPLSSFLQPQFQFYDLSLDLKYNPSYVTIYVQAKLLILGFTSVFSNLKESSYGYQLIFANMVIGGLIYLYYKKWPCYLDFINYIEWAILWIIFWVYIGAIMNSLTGVREVGWVFFILGTSTVLLVLLYRMKNKYSGPRVHPNKYIDPNQQKEFE